MSAKIIEKSVERGSTPSLEVALGTEKDGNKDSGGVQNDIETGKNDPKPRSTRIDFAVASTDAPKSKSSKVLSRVASTTESRRNPFAKRAGNSLIWTNVNMTLNANGKKLLSDVWGEVPAGEITALMGPSGAGKTTLLNILAGRAQSSSALNIESDIRMNAFQVDPTNIEVRKKIAFVAQDDSLPFTATPREAIRFSAKLRLPRITTDEEIEELTKKMLEELGLTECADTLVGGPLLKGISGGQRKRTSVGVELVTKPTLVFLDEPTSGLDSYSAMQVVKVLKKIAAAGCSVLFTIHQPSSEVFNSFDRLILMNRGMVMYQGPVHAIPDFFADRNHPVPKNYNPADWIMEVAQQYSEDELRNDGFFGKDERNLPPARVPDESELMDSLGISRHGELSDDEWKKHGFLTQLRLLFQRDVTHNIRNKKGLGARFAFTTFLSLLLGCIFFGVGGPESLTDPAAFSSHFGAMIMVLMISMFGTAMPTLLSFPEERPVFLREFSTNHYSVTSYFMSRLAMEAIVTLIQMMVLMLIAYHMMDLQMGYFRFLAIEYGLAMSSTAVAVLLGCTVEDPKMGTEFMPLLLVPQFLFAGFFIRTDLIPEWMRWAQYLCSLTYGVRLALLGEFGECSEDESLQPNLCAQLLNVNGVNEEHKGLYWGVLWALFVVFRLGALFMLRKKATKFY